MHPLLRTHRSLELAVLRLWAAGYRVVHLRRGDPVWVNAEADVRQPLAVRARVTGSCWPYRTTITEAQDVKRADVPETESAAQAA